MTQISPQRAKEPGDRPTIRARPDTLNRTGPLQTFRSLLRKPSLASHGAHGPVGLGPHSTTPQTAMDPMSVRPHERERRAAELLPDPQGGPVQDTRLDPLLCQMAVHSSFGSSMPTPPLQSSAAPSAALPLREDLQNLLCGLARRVAWGGDRRRGSARIELSEGTLAGATLVVHAEQRSVSVELELPAGAAAQGWESRLRERLEARGFSARVSVG